MLDKKDAKCYDTINQIGQFVTILSVNKTRDFDGRIAPILFCGRGLRPFFCFGGSHA